MTDRFPFVSALRVLCLVGVAACLGCGADQGQPAGGQKSSAAAPANSTAAAQPDAAAADAPGAPPAAGMSAQTILAAMVKAYKEAPGYEDEGEVVLAGRLNGQPLEEKEPYRVALDKPNKIRLQVYEGTVVSDGKFLFASVAGLPGQVLREPAPPKIGIESIFGDYVLREAMTRGFTADFSFVPVQMVLLLANDPLKTLLHGVSKIELLESGKIAGRACHRVRITRDDGQGVFWIDEETHVLRRIEYPTTLLQQVIADGRAENVSLVAEFAKARLAAPTDPRAFAYEIPQGAELSKTLLPPELAWLGQPSPDFYCVGMDGKPVTLKSLAGKVVLVQFWATWCQPCRETLPQIQQVYERYQNNPGVVFLLLSIDQPTVPDADVKKALEQIGVKAPAYRDAEQNAYKAFRLRGVPTTVLLDAKGRLQNLESGGGADVAGVLAGWIERLLAGKDVFADKRQVIDLMQSDYRRVFDHAVRNDLFIGLWQLSQQLPPSGLAPKSEPKRLAIAPLWKCGELSDPGQLLVVEQPGGPPRLWVIEGGRGVAELDPAGKVVARHPLKLPQGELVLFLRTALGADGKRRFVGSAPGAQQFHVFDEAWNLLWSFPPDATQSPHAGVGDVQIADLDGDGTLEACAGYRGLVGVKCVALEGKASTSGPAGGVAPGTVIWSQRGIANVLKIAVGPADAQRRRKIFCTNDQTSLAVLDAAGQIAGKVSLDGRLLYWIAAADAAGGGGEMCGLSAPEVGKNVALGIDASGNLLWSYDLPGGMMQQFVELVTPVRPRTGGPPQWLLVGMDGSIHLVGADGKPVDQFNYGALLQGLAVAHRDGKPVLLVASQGGVEALTLTWPQ